MKSHLKVSVPAAQKTDSCKAELQPSPAQSDFIGRLRRTQRQFLSFMQHSPALCWIVDDAGYFHYFNPLFLKTYQFSKKDIGKHVCALFPREIADEYLRNNERVFKANRPMEMLESGSQPGKGTVIYKIFKFPLYRDGSRMYLGGVAIDITEELNHRDALQRSNERFDYAAKATSDAIWDWDVKAGKIYRGEGFRTLFHFDALITEQAFQFDMVHPGDQKRVSDSLHGTLKGAAQRWSCEYQFKGVDGIYKTVLDKAYIIRDKHGCPLRVIGAMQDVTEQRRLQAQLRESEAEKKKAVVQAIIEAQEQERYEVSHQLHENISQVLAGCKTLLDAANTGSDPLLRKVQEQLQEAINGLRGISNRLNPETVRILGFSGAVEELVDHMQKSGCLEVTLSNSVDDASIPHHIAIALFRILQKQVSNVLRHAGATKVLLSLYHKRDTVLLTFADDGKGFDMATVQRGRGMNNIRNRAEHVGGLAEFSAAPGKGCSLKVSIPLR